MFTPTACGKLPTFSVPPITYYYLRFPLTGILYRVGFTGCYTIIKFIRKDDHEYKL